MDKELAVVAFTAPAVVVVLLLLLLLLLRLLAYSFS
jgi:hypothetical protein